MWQCYPGALLKLKYTSALVMDSFHGHVADYVKKMIGEHKTHCIPCGMTSLVQPLNICINWSFRAHLTHIYAESMATTGHKTTPTGRVRKPTLI